MKFGKIQRQRASRLLMIFTAAMSIIVLLIYALNSNINFFYTPSSIKRHNLTKQQIKLGGLVAIGSVQKNGLDIEFVVTDFQEQLAVHYHGVLPDLFKENQGVVVTGHLVKPNLFVAQQILAKHDENYKPPVLSVTASAATANTAVTENQIERVN